MKKLEARKGRGRRRSTTRCPKHTQILPTNSHCQCKEKEEKLFDVVCIQRLGSFSLSHADFGHRLRTFAAHLNSQLWSRKGKYYNLNSHKAW